MLDPMKPRERASVLRWRKTDGAVAFHKIPGVQIGDLLKAGARFEPQKGSWVFRDGSRGKFQDTLIDGVRTPVFVRTTSFEQQGGGC